MKKIIAITAAVAITALSVRSGAQTSNIEGECMIVIPVERLSPGDRSSGPRFKAPRFSIERVAVNARALNQVHLRTTENSQFSVYVEGGTASYGIHYTLWYNSEAEAVKLYEEIITKINRCIVSM